MSNNSNKRPQRISAIKRGLMKNEDGIKKWIEEDPELGNELVTNGVKTQEQIDAYFQKTPEEHRAI